MAGLPARISSWKYHNKNTSVELSEIFWFLIHNIQINERIMKRIKI